jgi:hypothetical protein
VIAYSGAFAPEAIEAIGLLGESRRDNRGSKYMSHIERY